MLKGFHNVTSDDAVVLAGSINPVETDNEMHIAYHAKNRADGNPPGLVKLRNIFQGEVDDWWYLLLCDKELMSELAEEAGWYLEKTIGGVVERENREKRASEFFLFFLPRFSTPPLHA